jgi:hypothetical protein
MEEGVTNDVNTFKREKNRPDGNMVVNPGFFDKVKFLENHADISAHFQYQLEAKAEIDNIGANAALSGKGEGSESGRALQVRQEGGLTEIGTIYANHSNWKKRIYRSAWFRVKQFWTAQKWVRVTDDEKNVKWASLNQPVTRGEKLLEQESGMDLKDLQSLQELAELYQQDPTLQQVAEVRNQTSEIDVDLILEDVPDIVNIQSEQFEVLANLYSANPDAIPFEMLIEMSSLRNKERILERLKGDDSPEAQQAMQERNDLQRRNAEAETAEKESKATLNMANAENKQVDTAMKVAGYA